MPAKARSGYKKKGRSEAQKLALQQNRSTKESGQDKENTLPSALAKLKQKITKDAHTRNKDYQRLYHNERRRNGRLLASNNQLKTRVSELLKNVEALRKAANVQMRKYEERLETIEKERKSLAGALEWHQQRSEVYQKTVHALTQRNARTMALLDKSRALVKSRSRQPTMFRLMHQGTYTPESRALARIMVKGGCSQAKVGPLIQKVAAVLGVKIDRTMSRRTVQRAILEGGVAAKMQLAFEIILTQSTISTKSLTVKVFVLMKHSGLTLSADSTSHRHQNIEAKHLAYRVPDYESGDPMAVDHHSVPRVRFAGVQATLDHSSEGSVKSWVEHIKDFKDSYERSPLAKRTMGKFTIREFLKKCKGMNGDHAASEKSTAKGIEQMKKEEALKSLGETSLLEMNLVEMLTMVSEWNDKKIADAGGKEAWDRLTPQEQAIRDVATVDALAHCLGEEAFNQLGPEDQRELTLFIWAGCCMHKDQNSFKGGNTAMMAGWSELGLEDDAPATLYNKQNAAVISKILDPEKGSKPPTEAEAAALEASTRGGVKLVALAGAIFSHQDDKKGQQDTHVDFFSVRHGKAYRKFPPTSKIRFGSFGEGAAELWSDLEGYEEFMRRIKFAKAKPGWTNMELNVLKGLLDIGTLTELAIMTIYTMAITVPYMRNVRGPGTEQTNVLNLGPLHVQVCDHIRKIIEDPDIILGSEASCEEGSLDGREWERPDAMAAIRKRLPELTHIRPLLVKFFEGALTTWIRFSAEFAPAGLIDQSSATEREMAWMPSTNDANEGALGAYRVLLRNKPRLTLHLYNAIAMFSRNNTQAFMDAVFTKEEHRFVMQEARRVDSSKLEATRKKLQIEWDSQFAAANREKEAARGRKEAETSLRLSKVVLVTSMDQVEGWTNPRLDEQLDVLRKVKGMNEKNELTVNVYSVPLKSKISRKDQKLIALKNALERHQSCVSLPEMVSDSIRTSADASLELEMVVPSWEEEEEAQLEDMEG